jgi:hypothetical protein
MSSEQMAVELDNHATGVVERLSEEGLIDAPTPTVLPLDPMPLPELALEEGAAAIRVDGETTIVVQVVFEDAALRLFSNVTTGFSHAVYDPLGVSALELIGPDFSDTMHTVDPCGRGCVYDSGCEEDTGMVFYEFDTLGMAMCLPSEVTMCGCPSLGEAPDHPHPAK